MKCVLYNYLCVFFCLVCMENSPLSLVLAQHSLAHVWSLFKTQFTCAHADQTFSTFVSSSSRQLYLQ